MTGSSSCSGGLTACDGACVDLASDPAHCGDCAEDCGPGGTCDAGNCACAGGGDVATDPANCGACGNLCAPGQTCAAGTCTCADSSVPFQDVQDIFPASCATNGCHKGAQAREELDLTEGNAHYAIVGVPANQCDDGRLRVAPGDPWNSYVLDKILGTDLCFGTRMPKLQALPGSDAQVIADWICGGALEN